MKDPLPSAVLEAPNRGRYYRMLPEVRRIRYPEIAGWFDPDTLASSPLPPAEMTSAAEEVFGDKIRWDAIAKDKSRPPDPTKKGWLKLRFHPWFRRWCVAPETRVLTFDLRWIPIEEVEVGQYLLGFDEVPGDHRRKLRKSEVLKIERIHQPGYELCLDDGTVLRASADHMWLSRTCGNLAWRSMETISQLIDGARGCKQVLLPKYIEPWGKQTLDEARLGGFFDGEGTLSFEQYRQGISYAQNPGIVQDDILHLLHRNNWQTKTQPCHSTGRYSDRLCLKTDILGIQGERIAFLGKTRPLRLLKKFQHHIECNPPQLTTNVYRKVVSCRPIGEIEVVAIETSTRTFIAEGFGSHNCLFEWAACSKDRKFYWRPVYIAAQPAIDGVLPEDLNHSDGRFDDLRGKLGEFYVPTKEDFVDFLNLASHEVNETAAKEVRKHTDKMDKEQREKERIQEDYTRAFNDYYAALACRDINRKFGTMQGLPFLPQTSLETIDKESQERRYHVEERNGYKIIRRKNRPVPDEDYLQWLKNCAVDRALLSDVDELQKGYLAYQEFLEIHRKTKRKLPFDEWFQEVFEVIEKEKAEIAEKELVPA